LLIEGRERVSKAVHQQIMLLAPPDGVCLFVFMIFLGLTWTRRIDYGIRDH
jgi:hypothetical protein